MGHVLQWQSYLWGNSPETKATWKWGTDVAARQFSVGLFCRYAQQTEVLSAFVPTSGVYL